MVCYHLGGIGVATGLAHTRIGIGVESWGFFVGKKWKTNRFRVGTLNQLSGSPRRTMLSTTSSESFGTYEHGGAAGRGQRSCAQTDQCDDEQRAGQETVSVGRTSGSRLDFIDGNSRTRSCCPEIEFGKMDQDWKLIMCQPWLLALYILLDLIIDLSTHLRGT